MTNREDETSSFALRRNQRALFPACFLALFGLVLVTACSRAPQITEPVSAGGEWREFQGTWTAAGSRNTLRFQGDRRVSISALNGSLVFAGASRPEAGFRSEAVVFNDTATGMVGRAVWTDERGDEAYSELRGEGTAANNQITGTFIGGTGRYAGVTGTYQFSWRFLIENEEGAVQGQSIGLRGRVRVNSKQTFVQGAPRL